MVLIQLPLEFIRKVVKLSPHLYNFKLLITKITESKGVLFGVHKKVSLGNLLKY